MKEKEGMVNCPEQQVILYVEKEDGRYGPIQTGSFLTANYLDDFFLKRKNLEEALKEQIRKREISPVHYFMILEDLTVAELAARVGCRKRKVKKHLYPDSFATIDPALLMKYSRVFNVTVDEMKNLEKLQTG